MRNRILFITCLLLCVLLMGACSAKKEPEQVEAISVETIYGTLYYPEQWAEFAQIDQEEEDGVVSVFFSAAFDDEHYSLFTVKIDGSDGAYAGQITDKSGDTHDVRVIMEKLNGIDELPENEKNRLYAMQEDLNFVIEHLS